MATEPTREEEVVPKSAEVSQAEQGREPSIEKYKSDFDERTKLKNPWEVEDDGSKGTPRDTHERKVAGQEPAKRPAAEVKAARVASGKDTPKK